MYQYDEHNFQTSVYQYEKYDFSTFLDVAGFEEDEVLLVMDELDAYRYYPRHHPPEISQPRPKLRGGG
jgi:hypothetical protein